MRRLLGEAATVGDAAAQEAVVMAAQADDDRPLPPALVEHLDAVDWSTWEPGDPDAAALVADESGHGAALRKLLEHFDVEIKSVEASRFDDLARLLAEGIARGDNAATIAKAIRPVLRNPERAELIAVTETARAISAAALDRYKAMGVTQIQWIVAPDDRVCDPCDYNAHNNEGPVAPGDLFPSGHLHPPLHPRCRCAISPVVTWDDLDDLDWGDDA